MTDEYSILSFIILIFDLDLKKFLRKKIISLIFIGFEALKLKVPFTFLKQINLISLANSLVSIKLLKNLL